MTKPIKLTKDRQGESFYPATTTDAVVDRKRVKVLSEILDDIDEAIQNGTGVEGKEGKSAYEVWLGQGNSGTEQDFLDSLKGADAVIDTTKIATREYVDDAIRSSITEIINTPV